MGKSPVGQILDYPVVNSVASGVEQHDPSKPGDFGQNI
jgi:hypothetical protein